MRVRDRCQRKSRVPQYFSTTPVSFCPCCNVQGAWKASHARARGFQCRQIFLGQNLADIPGQLRNTPRLVGIGGIALEQVAVIFHVHPAAAGRHDDGLGTGLDSRPPGVNIAPGEIETLGNAGGVMAGGARQQPAPVAADRLIPNRSSTRAWRR